MLSLLVVDAHVYDRCWASLAVLHLLCICLRARLATSLLVIVSLSNEIPHVLSMETYAAK